MRVLVERVQFDLFATGLVGRGCIDKGMTWYNKNT